MRTNYLDLAPFRRSSVGFDSLFDMMNRMNVDANDTYPPYDIEKEGEDNYRITLSLAGFRPEDVEVVAKQNLLTVSGRRSEEKRQTDRFVHKGIATRSFERRFELADFVQVESADFENGLLAITLKREIPETMKPRKIEIGAKRELVDHRQERQAESS